MVHLVVKVLAGLDIASFLACVWIVNHYNLDPRKNEHIWGDMVIMFRVVNFIRLCLTYYDPNEFEEDVIRELRTLVKRIQILRAWLMVGDVYPEMVSVICKRFYSGLYATYYPSRLLYLTKFCLGLGALLTLCNTIRLNRSSKLGLQVASALTLMFHFVSATKSGDSWGVWSAVWMACVMAAWIIEEDERNDIWLRFWARNFVNLGFTVSHVMFAKQLKRKWYTNLIF